MQILAVQGSPRGKNGHTDVILQEFLRGAQSAGARTRTVYLNTLSIRHCTGCYGCWVKTPGQCVIKDDMAALLDKILGCDVLVYVTPVYVYSMTSLMKSFIDRMLPLVEPYFVKEGDRYKHPSRYDRKFKSILVSSCGFPDMMQFDALRRTFALREELGHAEMIGELLMPSGPLLGVDGLKEMLRGHFDAFFRAGAEVVEHGSILRETEQAVQQLIFKPADFFAFANSAWDNKLAGIKNPDPTDQ